MLRRIVSMTVVALLSSSILSAESSFDPKVFFAETKKEAEQGNAHSQYGLGLLYANGLGVPKNDQIAVEWYLKAVEKGHTEAESQLGMAYETGIGAPRNYAKAMALYLKAAEKGNGQAQGRLGGMYALGRGVPKNPVLGYAWINIAVPNDSKHLLVTTADLEAEMSREQIAKAQDMSITFAARIKAARAKNSNDAGVKPAQ